MLQNRGIGLQLKIVVILLVAITGSVKASHGQENLPVNNCFPKVAEYVKCMPPRDSLWIFIMAGQSNMAGRAVVEPQDTLSANEILTINAENQWILAKEPLHFYEPSRKGLDCGVSFARFLLDSVPKETKIALIPCAIGGSSVYQWIGDSLHRNVHLILFCRFCLVLKLNEKISRR